MLRLLDRGAGARWRAVAFGPLDRRILLRAIGEVLKRMLPLSGEMRRSTRYSLTDSGREVARQLIVTARERSCGSSSGHCSKSDRDLPISCCKESKSAASSLRPLVKRGWIVVEEADEERDPLRAAAERLASRISACAR